VAHSLAKQALQRIEFVVKRFDFLQCVRSRVESETRAACVSDPNRPCSESMIELSNIVMQN
jgi:hypothetical protein